MSGERFKRNGEPATAAEWYVAIDSAAPDEVKAARFAVWLDRAAEHEPELERCAAAVEIARGLADDPELRFAYDEAAALAAGAPRAHYTLRSLLRTSAIAATVVAAVVAIWIAHDARPPVATDDTPSLASASLARRAASIAATAPASVPALRLPSGVVVDAGAVAVMPFATLPDDGAATANLAATLARDVGTELGAVPGIYVIGVAQATAYLGSDLAASEIGAQLGVRAIVVGDVTLQDGTVRIAAALLDAATDESLWRAEFERPLADPASLAEEIGAAVTAALIDPEPRSRAAAAARTFRSTRADGFVASVRPETATQ